MKFASLLTEISQIKKNYFKKSNFLILVVFIVPFHFPHLHNLYHDIALFFGYLSSPLHLCGYSKTAPKTAPNHHSLTLRCFIVPCETASSLESLSTHSSFLATVAFEMLYVVPVASQHG